MWVSEEFTSVCGKMLYSELVSTGHVHNNIPLKVFWEARLAPPPHTWAACASQSTGVCSQRRVATAARDLASATASEHTLGELHERTYAEQHTSLPWK